MGILMDTLEDTTEYYGQFLSSLEADSPRDSPNSSLPAPRPILLCEVCRVVIYSREDMEDHIRRSHWRQHIYLRVNGSIVRDDLWIERGIQECELVLLGINTAKVTIRVGADKREGTFHNGHRFESIFPLEFEGEVLFDISTAEGLTRQIHLNCRRLPAFNQDRLDRLVGKFQKDFDSTLQRPNLSVWRTTLGLDAGRVERRYLDGFFEYTLGSYLERSSGTREAKSHLEEAFGHLMPFRTPLALRAKWILAFKMNAFGVLTTCPDGSVFNAADAFFNRNVNRWNPSNLHPVKGSYNLYIDGFSSEYLDALLAYFGGNDSTLDRCIGALTANSLSTDRNNEDKLQLLIARVARNRGQEQEARRRYDTLKLHPLFGKEAEEFLHVNKR